MLDKVVVGSGHTDAAATGGRAGLLPPRPSSSPVVLRPLTIQVGEDVRPTSENGEAVVIGEFLEAQPDSSFRVLLPVAESLRRGGMDVTLHHPTNLGKLLSQAPGKLAALPATAPVATAPAATPVLSRVEVLVGRGGVLPFPVQTAAASAMRIVPARTGTSQVNQIRRAE